MRFEWDENKNRRNIDVHKEDFMKDEYTEQDMRNARKNPYAKMFTATDKLKIMLEAFIRENNWTREEAKKRINDILA